MVATRTPKLGRTLRVNWSYNPGEYGTCHAVIAERGESTGYTFSRYGDRVHVLKDGSDAAWDYVVELPHDGWPGRCGCKAGVHRGTCRHEDCVLKLIEMGVL